jgi:hypothetical protein
MHPLKHFGRRESKWERKGAEDLVEGERGHDFALQRRVTLDKASKPASRPEETRAQGLGINPRENDLGREGRELKNRRL